MPPESLDFSRRAELSELMDAPCSREVMRACLRDLAKCNRWFRGYTPTLAWLESLGLHRFESPVRIVDMGCGYGDTLRRIEAWALEHFIQTSLVGCDLSPDIIAIATEATPEPRAIQWVATDVFRYHSSEPIDIVVSALFTHHLTEPHIVRFIQWMEENARVGWFINDLSRAPIPYHLFKAFSKLANLHPFVQHDGPVSIARAFVPGDWRRMCTAAGLREIDFALHAFTPARLCVARKKLAQ